MHRPSPCVLLLACLATTCVGGEPAAEFPAGSMRDPAHWPFTSDSPWNMPLGLGAVYAVPSSPSWQETLRFGVLINTRTYTHPIFFAQPTDPLRWFWQEGKQRRQVRVPDAARSSDDHDAAMHVIDENRQFVTETLKAKRRSDMDIDTTLTYAIDLRGPGVFDRYQGACAYGGSTIAGVIRPGELRHGLRHALRMSMRPQVLNPATADGKGHVWPANSHEPGYSGTGNLWMGSLMALAPDLDLTSIGPVGSPAWHLAKGLQDYGAYIVDRGHLNFYAEWGAEEEVLEITGAQRKAIANALRVVVDNAADRIGGAGARRRPLAPPMLPLGEFCDAPLGVRLPKVAAKPKRDTPPPPPAPRRMVVAAALAAWDQQLQARVAAAIAAHKPPDIVLSQMRQRFTITALEGSNAVTLNSASGSMQARWSWLALADKAGLARSLVRPGDQDDLALAAFYCSAIDDTDAANTYLVQLDAQRSARVKDSFSSAAP
jgi:hypothetical protein